jgi:hypothetical protein
LTVCDLWGFFAGSADWVALIFFKGMGR